MTLTEQVKAKAIESGFARVGVCPAVTAQGVHRLLDWLAAGYAGTMHYIPNRIQAYEHPRHVHEGVRSLIMMAMVYHANGDESVTTGPGQGRVSKYAWSGHDYHDLIHDRLKAIVAFLNQAAPGSRSRGVVDTAPLMEREFAQLAGLGWAGKHTLLINPEIGSWFFLAAVLTDLELDYDAPFDADHCGSCRACLDACPTNAFPQAYVLDARRCISYLTIEHRGTLPTALRAGLDDWVFGCDICQQVCPWNRHASSASSKAFQFQPRPDLNPLELSDLFFLSDQQYRDLFRRTPMWRAKRRGLLRNAAVVIGNQRASSCFDALVRGLHDDESIVRATCVWALDQFQTPDARTALVQRRQHERDGVVLAEFDRLNLEAS